MEQGSVCSFSFTSRVLAGNPLNDPVDREVWVWEPPGAAGRGPLPVLYGLAGFTGTGMMMLHDAPWSPGLARRLDRLLEDGRIPPLRVVLPDCFTSYGGSQYVNSPATGRYRDYLCEEVVPEVEQRFDVVPDRSHRFLFGKSSGGFGALSLGMDHPELFGGVACQSGDMGFEYCYLPDFSDTIAQLDIHGGLEGFLHAFTRAEKKTTDLMKAMNIVAMSACYSPDLQRSGRFSFPFDTRTGRILPEIWDRWLALDPTRRVSSRAEALRSLKVLFLDCGTRDEFSLHLGARMLHRALEDLGIRHQYEEFDDGHMGISYRFERSLAALGRALS